MPATYSPAGDVKQIAAILIPKFHEHINLNNIRMEYIFIDKAPASGGKTRWGLAKKISGLYAFLANGLEEPDNEEESSDGDFFCIIISKDIWDTIDNHKRVALVDHELCHCGIDYDKDDNLKLTIIPHDVEDFACIVERHGLWSDDMERFMNRAENRPQTFLEFDDMPPIVAVKRGHPSAMTPKESRQAKEGVTMRIVTPDSDVTLTPEALDRAVERLNQEARRRERSLTASAS